MTTDMRAALEKARDILEVVVDDAPCPTDSFPDDANAAYAAVLDALSTPHPDEVRLLMQQPICAAIILLEKLDRCGLGWPAQHEEVRETIAELRRIAASAPSTVTDDGPSHIAAYDEKECFGKAITQSQQHEAKEKG